MKNIIKSRIGRIISFLNPSGYERFLAYSILFNSFPGIKNSLLFSSREILWIHAIKLASEINKTINFIEYGVHEGYSIQFFADNINDPNSLFIGLDSFDGLPEAWGSLPAGHFSTNGCIPFTNDPRITFVKGWFQDSNATLSKLISKKSNFIIHFDADLYSSTLYALTKADDLKQPYLAIFDEFPGHEARALYSYLHSYCAKVEFIGRTLDINNNPGQVLCRIFPKI
ncbi:hypothetical protein G6675_02015 [Polynucleobacter paneuropaeus]|nr:hypothetical protein [Polynucleobacter paneuropaeus]MBT8599722.1 hypothetical protein [Polynucleobacter paneuropaeus]